MKKAQASVSRNFRFDGSSAASLEFESRRKGVSLNSLVNNIFRKYSEFDRLAERTDMVTLNRYLLRVLLDSIPKDTLSDKAFEFGKETGHDNLLFWKKKVSVDTLREYITNTLCEYCNLAEYDIDGDTDTFVLTHELGPQGTVFLKSYIQGIVAGCLNTRLEVEGIGSTISFTLRERIETPISQRTA
jgi:hypothetical protein